MLKMNSRCNFLSLYTPAAGVFMYLCGCFHPNLNAVFFKPPPLNWEASFKLLSPCSLQLLVSLMCHSHQSSAWLWCLSQNSYSHVDGLPKKRMLPSCFPDVGSVCLVCSHRLIRCPQKLKLNPQVEGAAEADLESDPVITRKAEPTLGLSACKVTALSLYQTPSRQQIRGLFISGDTGGWGQSWPLCCRIFTLLFVSLSCAARSQFCKWFMFLLLKPSRADNN